MKKNKTLSEIAKKVDGLSKKEIESFLRAFLTPKEVATLCDRYKLVEMLIEGVPQREISKKLGVSISQISRGSEELQFGVGKEVF
ncbi:MAG: trp operon repressor, partial [Candidatus Peregrinibacteria bacterium]|nr:trp operon repressor [Candidatus Peregrinibacteria bacterium]